MFSPNTFLIPYFYVPRARGATVFREVPLQLVEGRHRSSAVVDSVVAGAGVTAGVNRSVNIAGNSPSRRSGQHNCIRPSIIFFKVKRSSYTGFQDMTVKYEYFVFQFMLKNAIATLFYTFLGLCTAGDV